MLLNLEPGRTEGDWLRATLVRVEGPTVRREGGLRVEHGLMPKGSVEDLADFVLTGATGKSVIPGTQLPAAPPPGASYS